MSAWNEAAKRSNAAVPLLGSRSPPGSRRRRSRRCSRPSCRRRRRSPSHAVELRAHTVCMASRPSKGIVACESDLRAGRPHHQVIGERDERDVVVLPVTARVQQDRCAPTLIAEGERGLIDVHRAPLGRYSADAKAHCAVAIDTALQARLSGAARGRQGAATVISRRTHANRAARRHIVTPFLPRLSRGQAPRGALSRAS